MNLGSSTSPANTLNKVDLMKSLRLLGVAVAGTVITFLAQWITQTDFGQWTTLVVPVVSFILEMGRRYLTNYSQNGIA